MPTQTPDRFTEDCVICGQKAAPRSDFCAECSEEGDPYGWNFGRCYFCRDFHDHEHCIGVPCQCPCPPPDQVARARERDAVLAKLTPAERQILGY